MAWKSMISVRVQILSAEQILPFSALYPRLLRLRSVEDPRPPLGLFCPCLTLAAQDQPADHPILWCRDSIYLKPRITPFQENSSCDIKLEFGATFSYQYTQEELCGVLSFSPSHMPPLKYGIDSCQVCLELLICGEFSRMPPIVRNNA